MLNNTEEEITMRVPGLRLNCEDDSFHVQCELDEHADIDRFLDPKLGVGVGLHLGGGIVELRWREGTDQECIVDFLRTLSEQALELVKEVRAA
ncbi:MAG TPA: hypothetical protein VG317_19655 [Pseudonocardiaceae bacterium]|jgi:hypothetical protein|nr:hypothetical protein [Pseudonocardiaceae bacterium]